MTTLQDQIDKLDEELKNPIPTPSVGTVIVWYNRAEKKEDGQIAGIVTLVEGVGKVRVTLFGPSAMPRYTVKGCLHMSHPVHQNRNHATSVNSGGWDYPDGVSAKKADYAMHISQLESRKQHLVDAQEQTSPKTATKKVAKDAVA